MFLSFNTHHIWTEHAVNLYNTAHLPGPVAQRLAQATHNRLVVGSNPTGPTKTWLYAPSRDNIRILPGPLPPMKLPQKTLTLLIIFLLVGCGNESAKPSKKTYHFTNTVVSLTFDDGNANNYQVRGALAENNLHATFYIVSGLTGTQGYMTEEELQGLYEDGNEIGGHTLNHTKLSQVRGADLKREVCQDRVNLLAYNFEVKSFAYPYGFYDEESKKAIAECGYNNARIVTGGPENISTPSDTYALKALPYIVKDTFFPKMVRYITETAKDGGWVIFTFHHVCNKCDQYAVTPDAFFKLAQWLGEQQQNGLIIKTVGDVIGGKLQPAITP